MNSTHPISQVVLVDDDSMQAKLYAAVLRAAFEDEIQLTVFSDSEQAATYLQSHLVDLLITDLRMPKVDGLDLIRQSKSRYPGVQVLVMTASSTAESLVDAAELGATDYLLKPFANELLVEIIAQARRRLNRWHTALAATLHHCTAS